MGLTFLALAALFGPSRAEASEARLCAAAPVEPSASIDAMLTAADAWVSPADRPRARGLYLTVLARDPGDEEAAVGLARVDAADGCYALAERGLRDVLTRSPANTDARAALADVLVWTGRWRQARDELDRGLAHQPLSPELLSRRGRVAYLQGDPTSAARWLAEAERVSPLDPEVRAARDRVFLGQARLGQRMQLFPSGYDDVYTTDTSAMQRWRELRFEASATVITRHGASRETRSGPVRTTITDGRPSFGVFGHFGSGAWAGGSIAVSAPALALPRWAFGLAGFTPAGRVVSLYLDGAFWRYRDDRDVTIVSPAVGVALGDAVDLRARYWLTSVLVRSGGHTSIDHVHSAGVRLGWRPETRLSLGLDYTYGVQLERNPTATELLDVRSHIVSVFAVRSITRSVGVDASASLERRSSTATAPSVLAPAFELGVFTRW